MALTKQAKVLSTKQVSVALHYLTSTRNPLRNQLIFLLSVKAGLRAIEIANLSWSMVLNSDGEVSNHLHLTNFASKGKSGGRSIPLNKELRTYLNDWLEHSRCQYGFNVHSSMVIFTERSTSTSPQTIVTLFKEWYDVLGFVGCSSHSGRRTFITNVSKKISLVGGSMRDVQYLAGHSSLQTTQRYIEGDSESRSKVVDLI